MYVTYDLDRLPEYGEHVVAIVLGDEWARRPLYAGAVRVVFKAYGTDYTFPSMPVRLEPYAVVSLIQDLRVELLRLRHPGRRRRDGHIVPVPIGTYRQRDLPLVPLDERAYDVYFGGSTTNGNHSRRSWRYWLRSPKNISRALMLEHLEALATQHPDLAIVTKRTANFLGTTDDDAVAYSHAMMQSRICVAPRGTSLETYRFFEGLRAGCVMICERLPNRPFYTGAPMVTIDDWSTLASTISALLADRERMQHMHLASLHWWHEHCAPAALGRLFADHI